MHARAGACGLHRARARPKGELGGHGQSRGDTCGGRPATVGAASTAGKVQRRSAQTRKLAVYSATKERVKPCTAPSRPAGLGTTLNLEPRVELEKSGGGQAPAPSRREALAGWGS